ncbi:hypothetical protein EYF80_006454 [Liparis tanakae]|uniref:Uncharacterized protein n=1 Tax=Liparis tanakae TaxID=230148 RepID=A0A4Z2J1Y5_9TELE|nr:hypothetical protein EYF80_006454 [Liparis tanakae]
MALNHHGDIAVEALQPLLVETLQDIVAKSTRREHRLLAPARGGDGMGAAGGGGDTHDGSKASVIPG